MKAVLDILDGIFRAAVDAASWVVIGLFLAGLVHEFVSPARLKKLLGGRGIGTVLRAVGMGVLLPMCSCGVVPTGIGLFRTGASLGSTLAFMASTPVINPAAVVLCLALLGPKITIIYVVTALVAAVAIGWGANRFLAGSVPPAPAVPAIALVPDEPPPFWRRFLAAMRWGFWELGTDIGYYLLIGMVTAGLIGALVPSDVVAFVLGSGAVLSLFAALAVSLPTYVCAIGSIPLVATLLVKGAAPGAAIVFLMAGPATNLGELFAIAARLGKRASVLFGTGVAVASLAGGVVANVWLGGLPYEVITGGGGALQTAALAAGPTIARFSCPPSLLPAVILVGALGAVGLGKRVYALVTRKPRRDAAPASPATPSASASSTAS